MACGELSSSQEDYLEAISHLVAESRVARSKDIAARLSVNTSSVTSALRSLSDKGLVNYSPYGVVTLTEKGDAAARDVIRRHDVLRRFFVEVLAVAGPEAEEAACRMEHAVPTKLLERFVDFVRFAQFCPRGGDEWIRGFGYGCRDGDTVEDCSRCMSRSLANRGGRVLEPVTTQTGRRRMATKGTASKGQGAKSGGT